MFEQFPPNSRYHGVPTKTFTAPDGRVVVHLARRFLPPADDFSLVREHVVVEGDRLDNLAARYLGDPELFWRVADANNAMRADALIEVGRRLRMTHPAGFALVSNSDA
jgi:hypothetical protein